MVGANNQPMPVGIDIKLDTGRKYSFSRFSNRDKPYDILIQTEKKTVMDPPDIASSPQVPLHHQESVQPEPVKEPVKEPNPDESAEFNSETTNEKESKQPENVGVSETHEDDNQIQEERADISDKQEPESQTHTISSPTPEHIEEPEPIVQDATEPRIAEIQKEEPMKSEKKDGTNLVEHAKETITPPKLPEVVVIPKVEPTVVPSTVNPPIQKPVTQIDNSTNKRNNDDKVESRTKKK